MPTMRARIRYAWSPAYRGIVRLVLGSLGRIARLSQLFARSTKRQKRRGKVSGRAGLFVRDMACATLSAREGERTMATQSDDVDDYDLFLSVLEDFDHHFALWLDSEILSVTIHGWDSLIQFIITEDAAMRLMADPDSMALLESAAAAIVPDCECHITYPVDSKGGKM